MLLIVINYINLVLFYLIKNTSSVLLCIRSIRRLYSSPRHHEVRNVSIFDTFFSSFLLGTGTSTVKDPGLGKLRAIMPPYHVATTANKTKHPNQTIYIL